MPASVREEDAFERAAAQLRPEWLVESEPAAELGASAPRDRVTMPFDARVGRAGTPPDASLGRPGAAFDEAEPSVIVQADIAALMERGSAGEVAQPVADAAVAAPGVASGFGVPSAFAAVGSVSTSTRHEATVVTRAPTFFAREPEGSLRPSGFRALTPNASARSESTLDDPRSTHRPPGHAQKRNRVLAIAAAACIALGVLIGLLKGGDAPQPVASAPAAAPVAPVVQPLPAATPVLQPAASNSEAAAAIIEPEKAAPVTARAPAASKPAAKKNTPPVVRAPVKLASKPVAAKPLKAPARAVPAKAVPAKAVPAKAVPAKAVPARAVPARAVPAKAVPAKGKAAVKSPAKGKPQPATKRERSPVDVLNPWAN